MKKTLTIVCSLVAVFSFAQVEFSGVSSFTVPYGSTSILEDLFGHILWRGFSAYGYVTSGLVGLWDGINNVGIEEHDSSSPVWKDLIGGRDLTLTSSGSFEANCLVISSPYGAGAVGAAGSRMSGGGTTEAVFKQNRFNKYNDNAFVYAGPGKVVARIDRIYNDIRANSGFGTHYGSPGSSEINFTSAATATATREYAGGAVYKNGVVLTLTRFTVNELSYTPSVVTVSATNTVTRFYCIRVYDRMLTPEEIAWNHSIDKERFNLP